MVGLKVLNQVNLPNLLQGCLQAKNWSKARQKFKYVGEYQRLTFFGENESIYRDWILR